MNDLLVQLALWQVALPAALITLHAVIPAASPMVLVLRTAAILALLLYAALAGLWLFPPWWTPYALALIALLTSLRLLLGLRRGPTRCRLGLRAEVVLAALLLAGAGTMILPVLEGRRIADAAIDLDIPLGPGRYLVVSGGTNPALNVHLLALGHERAADFRDQTRGVDIIGIDALGLRATAMRPRDPQAYAIHGKEVRAPCSGRVVEAIDGLPDNEVPRTNRDRMAGNHVILDCDGLAVVLAHFRPGSISVARGDGIASGQTIARVGNSGNSDEPHLHMHVQTFASPENPFAGDPLWFTLEGDLPVRNARFHITDE